MSKSAVLEALKRGGFAFLKYDRETHTTYYENRFTGVIVTLNALNNRVKVIAA